MTTPVPHTEPNLLERAYQNYGVMEDQLAEANRKIVELSIVNGSLSAEVSMLREELARADADRIRLQAVASTLSGELLSIRDVIDGSVRRALEAGVIAHKTPPAEPEKAIQEASVVEATKLHEQVNPPHGAKAALAPPIDWSTPMRKPS